jgi:hypothetical protein
MRGWLAVLLVMLGAAAVAAEKPAARLRVLVLEPTGKKVSADDKKTLTGLMAASLSRWPMFDVVTADDLRKAMELNAQRQLLGCATDSCLSDLAGLTDAKLVVFGDVNRLGKLLVLNLNLFDSGSSKSVGRVSVEARSLEELPSRLRLKSDELVADPIRAFRARGSRGGKTCPEGMLRVPGGQFFMGADDDDTDRLLKNAKPSHNVTLPLRGHRRRLQGMLGHGQVSAAKQDREVARHQARACEGVQPALHLLASGQGQAPGQLRDPQAGRALLLVARRASAHGGRVGVRDPRARRSALPVGGRRAHGQ